MTTWFYVLAGMLAFLVLSALLSLLAGCVRLAVHAVKAAVGIFMAALIYGFLLLMGR